MFEELEANLEQIDHGFEQLEMTGEELETVEADFEELEELDSPCVEEFLAKFEAAQANLQQAIALIPQIRKILPFSNYSETSSHKIISERSKDQPLIFIRTRTGAKKDAVIIEGTFVDNDKAEKFLKEAIVTHKSFYARPTR